MLVGMGRRYAGPILVGENNLMRRVGLWLVALGFVVSALYVGCAASDNKKGSSSDGGSSGGSGGSGGEVTVGPQGGNGGSGGLPACAKFTAEAEQAPAAMLIVLDMTASMTVASKWSTAQQAVVAAIDKDVFDSMGLGLVTFPPTFTPPPQCVCDYIDANVCPGCCSLALPNGVSCGVSGLPQVAMAVAGMDKSNASTGVRHEIYDYLVNHSPVSNEDDGSPAYEAMTSGYSALSLYPGVDKRMLLLITDGGFSCTSLSNRPGYTDDYGCPDWEHPDVVNQLIVEKRDDPSTPIETFIIGVPGSDSNGQPSGPYATPPYSMKLALSTYAVNGSPDNVDPGCDSGLSFMQNGAPPTNPCHFDLTQGQFNANALADAIEAIRGKALGCVYPLPDPPPGETIDLDLVNVDVTVDGVGPTTIPRRSNPNDTCDTDGCWDYNAQNEVVLIGKTCTDVSEAESAKVDIVVGCETIIK
jgi:hypothetical protein